MAKLAINLRGDLAKLSDAELAERLQRAWGTYEAATKPPRWFFGRPSGFRGPVRHPRAYRFMMGLEVVATTGWIGLLLPLVLSSKLTDRLMERVTAGDPELTLREIQDLTDEIERRVRQRKASTS